MTFFKCQSLPSDTDVVAPIPTMVEHLNGETSDEDEDDEDSEAESSRDNCSVHSTTAGHSNQPRRTYTYCAVLC